MDIICNSFNSHTSSARAGVENLMLTLALEWAEYGIRINSVAPVSSMIPITCTYNSNISNKLGRTL